MGTSDFFQPSDFGVESCDFVKKDTDILSIESGKGKSEVGYLLLLGKKEEKKKK